ncbi:MAG: 4Fe-4S binding protein [Clostridiales bacterium]
MFIEIEKTAFKRSDKQIVTHSYKYDLQRIPAIKKLLLWKAFPYLLQLTIFIVLVGLIIMSWGLYSPDDNNVKLFSQLNIVCLIIWGLWWPLMIWVAVLLGRLWCMVCPLEFISKLSEKLGKLLKINRFKISRAVRSGIVILCLYFFVQLLVAGTDLHHVPAFTAFFLAGLISFAIVIGLFFKEDTFCSGFCPIALTLNTYSRGGMLAIRADSKDKCKTCRERNCATGFRSNKIFSGKSCPGKIYPALLESNKDCLLCGQCIKNCSSGNMKLFFRFPFSTNDIREKAASWVITLFIMIDSGFVIGELAEQWPTADKAVMAIPELVSEYLGLQTYSAWIEGIWTLLVFPLLLWTIFGLSLKIAGKSGSISDAWRNFALRAVIIFSAGHLIKSLLKVTESLSYITYAIKDPKGLNNLKAISSGVFSKPDHILSPVSTIILCLIIISFAIFFTIREQYILKIQSRSRYPGFKKFT